MKERTGARQFQTAARLEVNQPDRRQICRLAWVRLGLVLAGLGWFNLANAATVSQGYKTSESLVAGTIVSLDASTAKAVKAATISTTKDLLGVVVTPGDVIINLSSTSDQVQVSTSGVAPTLVSNINGSIKAGDRITASAIAGVGSKTSGNTKIIGIAQGSLNAQTAGADKRQIKDLNGKNQEVLIAKIPVTIEVGYFDKQGTVAGYAQQFVSGVTGRDVSAQRALAGIVILILALTVVGVMLSTSVKSSIISIGRNPLSRSAVQRSLWGVLLIAVAVLALAGVSIFLIVR